MAFIIFFVKMDLNVNSVDTNTDERVMTINFLQKIELDITCF
jgi:hypothetical protein